MMHLCLNSGKSPKEILLVLRETPTKNIMHFACVYLSDPLQHCHRMLKKLWEFLHGWVFILAKTSKDNFERQ